MNLKKIANNVVQMRYLSRWLILAADLFFSVSVSALSFLFVSYILDSIVLSDYLRILLPASACASVCGFLLTQSYKGIIRHSVYTEVGRMALASIIKVVLLFIVMFFSFSQTYRAMFFLPLFDLLLTFFTLTLIRVALILVYHTIRNWVRPSMGRLLVFGETEDHFISVPESGIVHDGNKWQLVGGLKWGSKSAVMRLGNLKTYSVSCENEFVRLVDSHNISGILFSDVSSVRKEANRLVSYCLKYKLKMLFVSGFDELENGKLKPRNLSEVKIEDLLGREEIRINMEDIAATVKGQTVMVTGAAGSIGSELCRQLCMFGVKELVLFDNSETPMHNIRLELEERFPEVIIHPIMGDVRLQQRVDLIFEEFRPQYVFHAAAYKHVPLMEENPCEAVHTNVFGSRIVADTAVKYGVKKFVMVSTDKAVNPTNVMGASKRLAEIYVQSLGIALKSGRVKGSTQFITTRFGNVLGSNGSVIPRFKEQLMKGGPITVTHPDIIRYFMTIPEACRLVLEAGIMGKGNEIFVFDMGTPVKIADLAKRMIQLAGLVLGRDIQIEYTGLRPGEKLYEELLNNKENTLPTSNEKIFRAKVREYDYFEVSNNINELTELALKVLRDETVKKMKEIVPEFISNNSVYEKLDQTNEKDSDNKQ